MHHKPGLTPEFCLRTLTALQYLLSKPVAAMFCDVGRNLAVSTLRDLQQLP
jgi:hypothetical protein